jgi:hypothetical protein
MISPVRVRSFGVRQLALLLIRILRLVHIGSSLDTQPQAPKGPSVSSRRFQPAESVRKGITATPKGLTYSSAPAGSSEVLGSGSMGFTHGYSWLAPAGQGALHRSVSYVPEDQNACNKLPLSAGELARRGCMHAWPCASASRAPHHCTARWGGTFCHGDEWHKEPTVLWLCHLRFAL